MALSDRFRGRLGGGMRRTRPGDTAMFNPANYHPGGPVQGDPRRPAAEPSTGQMTTSGVMRQFGPQHGQMGPDNELDGDNNPLTGIEHEAAGPQRHSLGGTIRTQRDRQSNWNAGR